MPETLHCYIYARLQYCYLKLQIFQYCNNCNLTKLQSCGDAACSSTRASPCQPILTTNLTICRPVLPSTFKCRHWKSTQSVSVKRLNIYIVAHGLKYQTNLVFMYFAPPGKVTKYICSNKRMERQTKSFTLTLVLNKHKLN